MAIKYPFNFVKTSCPWVCFSYIFCSWTYHIAQNFMNNFVYVFDFFLPSNGKKISNLAWTSYFIILFGKVSYFFILVLWFLHLLAWVPLFPKHHLSLPLILLEHVIMTNPLCVELLVYNYMIIFLMIIKILHCSY